MTPKSHGILTPLQRSFLERLKVSAPDFYLSGGSALSEFYLGHRVSQDLDVFTNNSISFQAVSTTVMAASAEDLFEVEALESSSHRRRFLLTRESEQVLVDAIHEISEQIDPKKPTCDGIRIDTLREIGTNKLCAILHRSELKDLVDLYFIEKAGISPLDRLPDAQLKEGGVTPASLAYSFSQIRISDSLVGMISEVSVEELRSFRDRLVDQLTRMAFPEDEKG